MIANLKNFLTGQSGSVTTDWVVLVASLILMAVLILTAVTGGTVDLSDDLSTTISDMEAG